MVELSDVCVYLMNNTMPRVGRSCIIDRDKAIELIDLVNELRGGAGLAEGSISNWHTSKVADGIKWHLKHNIPQLYNVLMAELRKHEAPAPGQTSGLMGYDRPGSGAPPWEGGDESGMRGR